MLLGFVGLLSTLAMAANLHGEPVTVVVRVPTDSAVPADLASQFAALRDSGAVTSALLLNNARPEHPPEKSSFEAFGLLEFADEAAFSKWQAEGAGRLPAGLIVRRVDQLAGKKRAIADPARAVYIVLTYTPNIGHDPYADYANGYIRPLLDRVFEAKALDRYAVYLERGEVGNVQAYSFQVYRDDAAFAGSGKVKVATKAELAAADARFKHFQEIKESLGSDDGGTFVSFVPLQGGAHGSYPHVFAREHAMSSYRPSTYTLAQKLVDGLTAHPEVEYGLISARLPAASTEYGVVASHRLAEVGAAVSPADRAVLTNDDSGLVADLRDEENHTRSRYVLQMKDASGKFIPAFLSLFLYTRTTDDQAEVKARAQAIRDELAAKVATFEALFGEEK